jgi:hypothetical protein
MHAAALTAHAGADVSGVAVGMGHPLRRAYPA